ncbi:hypothetical protein RvY_10102 [Ramazzottius varieornatus]|uniref:Uncharacterized protein n=1 Tax=Ramazzottius varieornatus TaxID=947166 RepID=A0A1D1VBN4_RAMVA|nr:hypothetical protein RvY_10102 [Ramazzottius varieornatus]
MEEDLTSVNSYEVNIQPRCFQCKFAEARNLLRRKGRRRSHLHSGEVREVMKKRPDSAGDGGDCPLNLIPT